MPALTDQDIANALLAGDGILSADARYLAERLHRPITRSMVAQRVEGSRVLLAVRQIAEDRGFERSLAAAQRRRQQRRSASMRLAWARRREGQVDAPNDLEHVDALDAPNARARARTSRAVTPTVVQAARDSRLCCARTRKGLPCVRRVVPGRNRCPSHGGLSTGPTTEAGKARIAASQRARWQRWRQERVP